MADEEKVGKPWSDDELVARFIQIEG